MAFTPRRLMRGASAAREKDPYFNYVTMLLHGDGTNGAQNNTFVDGSTNNFTLTRNGNVTQGSFSPYGSNWSNFFLNTGNDNRFGWSFPGSAVQNAVAGTNYTIEFWVFRLPFVNTYQCIFSTENDRNNFFISNSNILEIKSNGGTVLFSIAANTYIPLNTWTHVALVCSGTTWTLYFNGTSYGTYSGASKTSYVTGTAQLGGRNDADGCGYLSNFRVSTVARYSANFTPSTTPFTSDANTAMLTCQSNRYIDVSTNAQALTTNGTISVQRFNPFGTSTAYSPTSVIGGSGYFDGTGDYLTASSTNIANFGTGDFIVSAWFNSSTTGSSQKIFDNYNGNNNVNPTLLLNIGGAGIVSWYAGQSALINSSSTYMPNTWNYVVVSRVSSTTKMFLNGTQVGSVADTRTYVAGNANIGIGGEPYSSGGTPMVGYITDLQVVKGSGVTSSTVPTAPVSTSGTTFALSFTNGAIIDNAMMNDLETVNQAQISTSVKKYGTGSLYFDGTGDYLLSQKSNLFAFGTGDFTVEFWMYTNSTASEKTLMGTASGYLTGGWQVGFNFGLGATNCLQMLIESNPQVITSSEPLSTATWYYIAITRSGTSVRLFVNGTQQGATKTSSSNISDSAGNALAIGRTIEGLAGRDYNGYIDDLRITKGYARYTANIAAPTVAFSDTGPY